MAAKAKRTFAFLTALLATNIQAPLALRTSFFMQMFFMLLNNLVYFCVWWIFFNRFEQINGWGVHEMEVTYAITAGAFGLFVVLGSGARQIANKIVNGDLDNVLVQPKNPLLIQVASLSQPSGWGDLITAVILFGMSGYAHGWNLLLLPLFVVCGAFIFLATVIMVNSLAFWLGQVEQLARQYFEFVITFSVYPQNIFPIYFKFALFTVLPAGFIAYLPVVTLKENQHGWVALLVAATVVYLVLAHFVFFRGLKRYESGNRVG